MKRLILVIFLTFLTLGFIITGFLGPAAAAEKDKYGGVIRVSLSKGPTNFGIPIRLRGENNPLSRSSTLESLILETRDKSTILPFLATEWEISPDRKSVTFKLRKGVKFHDGTDFNAQAAKFNLDEFEKNPARMQFLKSVDIVDDHTIRLNIDYYNSGTMTSLGREGMMISPTAYEKNGEKWCETNPVGTGPFKLEKYSRDEFVKFKRFDGYWQKGRPYLDGLEWLVIRNAMTQIAAFRTDKVDGLYNVPNETAKFLGDVGFPVSKKWGPVVTLAGDSKNSDSVWANRKVREAVEYAIDMETITKKLGYGFPEPVYQIIDQGNMLACQDCPPRKYDPDKARKLLAEAGYPDGFKTTLQHHVRAWPEVWVAIQADLKKVGIDLEVIPIEAAKFEEMIRAEGSYTGVTHVQLGTNSNTLMTYVGQIITGGDRAPVTVRPAGVDDAILKASRPADPDTEIKFLRQVNKLIYDDVTFIPLYVSARLSVMKKYVHDLKYGVYKADAHELFTHAWMSKK
jgi:ABC-type transport system substrate-binding protein